MTKEQVELMSEVLSKKTVCPCCGKRTLRTLTMPTKSRKTYQSIHVGCLHCRASTRLFGLPGWRNTRALDTIIDDLRGVRDKMVALELMGEPNA